MRRALTLAGLTACLLAAGCGGTASIQPPGPGSTVTLLMAAAPGSLDPAVGHTPEAFEADWLVYTPLLTYNHSSGLPGTIVVPGLAASLPVISDGGRTYSLTLLPGLMYSNGLPVKASDFTWAVERAVRLGWSQAPQLVESRIVGAAAFAAERAKTISGISTNDATGQITIHLTAPYGPFDNVLAMPALAPVPRTAPLRDEPSMPPPGLGPYEFAKVVPDRSFLLVPNPRWQRGQIPAVPISHVTVAVRVTGNAAANALAVLRNSADVFDWADQIPAPLLPRIHRDAAARYAKQAIDTTYLIFMNVTRRPFSSPLARIAVQTALDDSALKELDSGELQEGCYLLPPSVYGHSHDQCPRGDIEKGGDVAAARELVARSGMAGTRVTVWAEAAPPFSNWMAYYRSLLEQIGFSAQLKLVPAAAYWQTIGDLRLHPQTGFGAFAAVVPEPVDFYQRLTSSAIQARGNQNWGEIRDSYLNAQVRVLESVPSSNPGAVASFWHELERYVADRAYVAVFGYQTAPQFVSKRLAYSRLVLNPVAGLDWTSFHLR